MAPKTFTVNVMPPDHLHQLDELAQTALAVLPCKLAWLLSVDDSGLVHQAVAADGGAEAEQHFLSLVQQPAARFPLAHHPLADVVTNGEALINVPVVELREMAGGAALHRAFTEFGLPFVSALPLVASGEVVGVLVVATTNALVPERTQQLLNSLSSQAAMILETARLRAFREMVLDAMGEGLLVVNQEAQITFVNNRLLLMTGYEREALYGRSVGVIFHPDQREQLVRSLSSQAHGTLSFSQKLVTTEGRALPVMLSRATLPGGQSTVLFVSDLSELQHHEEALQRQTLRLQAINRASNAISSASSLQDVLHASLDAALEIVSGIAASILLLDPDNPNLLTTVAASGPHVSDLRRTVDLDEGLVGWAASTSRSQLVTDVSQHEQVQAQYPVFYGIQPQSIIVVPLVAFDEVVGGLEVVNKSDGVFDSQDLDMLESLAGSAAIAIENARLFDETRRRVSELSMLLDASAAASSTLDFSDILERIAQQLSVALHVERVLIMDWHRPANTLTTLAEVVNAYWSPGEGPLYRAEDLPLVQAIFETNTGKQAASTPIEAGGLPSGLQPAAAFPITIHGHVTGVVTLYGEANGEPAEGHAVTDEIARWEAAVQEYDAAGWWSRANLTDLCQRVLQASGFLWCNVMYRDQGALRLLREIGRVIWPGERQPVWEVSRFSSLARVLDQGEALTFQRDELLHDSAEKAYLRRVGGNTCLAAPLLIRGEASGLVKLIDSKSERRIFDDAELSLCQGIANVVGNAMENAQLYTAQEQRASALEEAYKELQDADQLKDDLLQNLSHELRTPLTHVLGYLRLMADGALGPLNAQQIETLELVTGKAQHLAELINDIVSVQESEAHNLVPKSIRIERVVALAVRASLANAQAKDILMVARVAANLPPVYADPVRLEEVFAELLENAVKFSPRATQIEIVIDDPGGPMIHACVCDQGIGIAPEEHERIFRRFYQVESGTTRRFAGTGLGLTIVRKIIEGHKGRVWVESEPGKGSCFHLTLPKASTMA